MQQRAPVHVIHLQHIAKVGHSLQNIGPGAVRRRSHFRLSCTCDTGQPIKQMQPGALPLAFRNWAR
jgi:hypothetical protein